MKPDKMRKVTLRILVSLSDCQVRQIIKKEIWQFLYINIIGAEIGHTQKMKHPNRYKTDQD
jgi:hypothetical protein